MKTKPVLRNLALGCVLSFSAASTVNAATIPIIDISDDAFYSYTWNEDLTLGFEFTVTSTVTFNALAVFDVINATHSPLATPHDNELGLNTSHRVGVWRADGSLVVDAVVDDGDPTAPSVNNYGNWVYQSVTPTTLTAGTYTIGAFYAGNSDSVMVQQTALDGNGAVYVSGRYLYSSTFGRPTEGPYTLNEEQYFGPTMMQIPDGGMTLTLLGGAMMGLVAFRRRFRA